MALLLANTPEMIEAHFGVPMTGAVMFRSTSGSTPRASRSSSSTPRRGSCSSTAPSPRSRAAALARLNRPPLVVDVDDSEYTGPGERIGSQEYEGLLASGDPGSPASDRPTSGRPISLNYTSGTTGNPKGVVVHHRGAHLNAVGNILTWDMPRHSVYLWTLPMFHCNGWCFPWTMAANAGTNVCLRSVDAASIYRLWPSTA